VTPGHRAGVRASTPAWPACLAGPAGLAWLALCLNLLATAGCDQRPSVVVYVSADEQVARPILAEFERAHGIRVVAKFDTEATKTTGLAATLRAERSRPRADVFWSSEVFMTVQLADEGVLAEHRSPETDEWPAAFRDPTFRWFGFAARARVLVYAPDRVAQDEVPAALTDLTRSWWKGRLVMADPRFGTTRGHFGAMRAFWNSEFMPGYYEAFLEGLAENDVRSLTTGNAGVVDAVVSGEADAGLTDTDDVWVAMARGAKLGIVYLRFDPDAHERRAGTLLIPNTVARVADGSNAETAAKLIAFLLSPRVEQLLLESDSHNIPLRPELQPESSRELIEKYRVDDPLWIDYARVAEQMDRAVEQAGEALRRP